MNSKMVAAFPLGLLLTSGVGCLVPSGNEEMSGGIVGQAATACPSRSAQDDVMRAAATVAFNIMRDAAKAGGTMLSSNLLPSSPSALAPQRYRIMSSGTGIEFDPTDALYSQVSNQMKADLAIAELDSSVAKFLSDGLNRAYATTTGITYPAIHAIGVLANYKYPGPITVKIHDYTSNNDSHVVTATGQAWCGTSLVNLAETVQNSWQFAPLMSDSITTWRGSPPAGFKGQSANPTTPFNGPSSSGNPYLVVSVNDKPTNWATYNFSPVSCYSNPNFTCTGSIQIDPVPYAEPGAYYNVQGLVGTQENPFDLSSTVLYANPDHAQQWATRTVNSTPEWGTFSKSLTLFGMTIYRYVKQF
jgi:hypothetical protein